MLTSDLVRVSVRKGEVFPRFVDPADAEHRALAGLLIETFEAHIGRTRGELDAELKEVLGTGTSFLLHRGLAKLLLDRCRFDTQAPAEPEELRRAVFAQAAKAYHRSGDGQALVDRAEVLRQAAGELGLEVSEVERGLYADLKDEQVLEAFDGCSAPWLLERYNTALAQAVLLRAEELVIEIRGETTARYRALFRKLKFFQLLHRIRAEGDGYRIVVDGPMSLFRASTRYGLQMATFLPTLLHFAGWKLEARLLWGKRRLERTFRLSAEMGLASHTRLTGQWRAEELDWLPEQFAKLDTEWRVSTETEILDLGTQGVLVPDFVFHHPPSGRRVSMEVFGFWNRGAVAGRIELLRRHGPTDLILALSKALAAEPEALEDLPAEVYVFRTAPVAREVRRLLESRFSD
ncbi:MAG: DUF790 family protein [Acidobacteria bacterium]|nr:DUF790 family protein [Acidobacteriota bacterium]